jgi:Protein of unknown function (DUF3153)
MNISNLQKIVLSLIEAITFRFIKNRLKPISWVVISAAFMLSGCVQYDLGINYNNTNNGEIVQHIQLSEKLTSFSGDYIWEWLNSLERRARKLEGSARRISPEELIVKIPFSNGRELQEKFSGFFNYRSSQNPNPVPQDSEIPTISSNLLVEENNFLLLSRNHLIYDLDLRSLSALTSKRNVLPGNASVLNLDFSLQTPWGVRIIQRTEDAIQPQKLGNQLVWQLKPGELNHIEVVFWLPNLLGFGTLIIIVFVWGGFYLRYTLLSDSVAISGFTELKNLHD